MDELEYLLTKCGLVLNYPNCLGNGKCSTCDNKKRIEYDIERYKARENDKLQRKIHIIL